jgi:hypothetical protein
MYLNLQYILFFLKKKLKKKIKKKGRVGQSPPTVEGWPEQSP